MKKVIFIGVVVTLFCIIYTSCKHTPEVLPATAPSGLLYTPNTIEVKTGNAISSAIPVVSGSQPISYSISTIPFNGGAISINENGVIVVDTSAVAAVYEVTVTAINSAGRATFTNAYQITVSQTVNPPTSLIYATDTLKIKQDTSITSAPPTVTGTHPMHYSITTSPASAFIVINDSTGAIRVDSNATLGTYTVNVTASNSAGSKVFDNAYIVLVNPVKPSGFTYTVNSISLVAGMAGSSVAPTVVSSIPVTFSIASITNNPTAGQISIDSAGQLTVGAGLAVGSYAVSVTAANAAGSVTIIYNITISAAPVPPNGLTYAGDSVKLNFGAGGSSATPTITGTTPVTYSISPSIAGITIDDTSGKITAAGSLAVGAYLVSVTATNSAGSQSFANACTVVVNATVSYAPNTLTVADDATGASVAPTTTGGITEAYTIATSPASADITINSSTGVISVAKGAALGTYTVTVNATDAVATTYTVKIIPSFTVDILPIMKKYCTSCHNGSDQDNYNTYSIVKGQVGTILVRIQQKVGSSGFMPKDAAPLSAADIALIQQWKSTGEVE